MFIFLHCMFWLFLGHGAKTICRRTNHMQEDMCPFLTFQWNTQKQIIGRWTDVSAANNHIVFEDYLWLRITFWKLHLHSMECSLLHDMHNYTPIWFEAWITLEYSFILKHPQAIQFRSKILKCVPQPTCCFSCELATCSESYLLKCLKCSQSTCRQLRLVTCCYGVIGRSHGTFWTLGN